VYLFFLSMYLDVPLSSGVFIPVYNLPEILMCMTHVQGILLLQMFVIQDMTWGFNVFIDF
jgi:hypothetical protein